MLWLMTEYIITFSHIIRVSKKFFSKRSQSFPFPIITSPDKRSSHHVISVYIESGWYTPAHPHMKLMYMPRDTSDPYYQSVGSMSRVPYAGPYWRLFIERVPNHYNIAGLVGFIPSSRMPYDVIICVRNVYLLPQDGLAYPLPVVPDINQQDILTLRATTSGWN